MEQTKKKKKTQKNCESCLYYDYDEEYDSYICTVTLDEDEAVDFMSGRNNECAYYKYYDEYKSVRKQN